MNAKFIIAATLLVSSLSAFAASTGQLNLNGTVGRINELIVAEDAAAQTLNIVEGASNLQVATVTEISNDKNGFDIMMSSTNAGKLVHTEEPSMSTTYTLSYNNLPAVSPDVAPAVVKTVTSLTGLSTLTSDVKLNVTAYPTAAAGDYRDTITFSIVAK